MSIFFVVTRHSRGDSKQGAKQQVSEFMSMVDCDMRYHSCFSSCYDNTRIWRNVGELRGLRALITYMNLGECIPTCLFQLFILSDSLASVRSIIRIRYQRGDNVEQFCGSTHPNDPLCFRDGFGDCHNSYLTVECAKYPQTQPIINPISTRRVIYNPENYTTLYIMYPDRKSLVYFSSVGGGVGLLTSCLDSEILPFKDMLHLKF